MIESAALPLCARERLLAWYEVNGRHALPWRLTRDPYAVLVSEVMLQQTQVDRVTPKYHAFLATFPTFEALAAAPTGDVIRQWRGLGYNRRAVNLQQVAAAAVEGGGLPSGPDELRALPGIGTYTAAAIACFAFGADVAVVDTNIRRVLGRLLAGDGAIAEPAARRLAEPLVRQGEGRDWNLALMDLGATVCIARAPACHACPFAGDCAWQKTSPPANATLSPCTERGPGGEVIVRETRSSYRAEAPFIGSRRWYRGRIVEALRALPPGASLSPAELGRGVRADYGEGDEAWLLDLVTALARDGLATLEGDEVRLP